MKDSDFERICQLYLSSKQDRVVNSVIEGYIKRSKTGMSKYGTTLDRNDLSRLEWLIHLQEELMDATLYIEKLKNVLDIENK